MIFDDHDVIDDWNTSRSWLDGIRAEGWWDERITGAFMSYWIFQHLGNLSPEALEADALWRVVRESEDAEEVLHDFAWRADRTVDSTQWSFCRDIGSARLVMVDSRAGRILDSERRTMVDDAEWDFIERSGTGHHHRHLLIGTSLPWLMAPGMHHLEAWDEAVGEGAWGSGARQGGREAAAGARPRALAGVRQLVPAADRRSSSGSGPGPTASRRPRSSPLSGDVHHAYLAEVAFPTGSRMRSRVYQAVCSPFRNPLDTSERRVIQAISSAPAALVTRALARRAGVPDPPIRWKLRQKAVFDNVVATLHLDGDEASLTIERARPTGGSGLRLETAFEGTL